MKSFVSVIAFGAAAAIGLPAGPALAHNVWCHCPQKLPLRTLDAFKQAEVVTALEREMLDTWYRASVTIEHGVIAEFEAKLNGSPLAPQHFVDTLDGLRQVRVLSEQYRDALVKFRGVVTRDPEPTFAATLDALLGQSSIQRLASSGIRFSNVAGVNEPSGSPTEAGTGCGKVIDMLLEDLALLQSLLDETIIATRDAIPLAQKGEFAKVMLSGRNRFGDKMPQLTDAFSRYDRLYVELILATISTTMQVYPRGFQFL